MSITLFEKIDAQSKEAARNGLQVQNSVYTDLMNMVVALLIFQKHV
jgi:hypothetical protein